MAGSVALLAAGASSRMRGADKLLQTVGGIPLVRLLAERALGAGWPVRVTLPPDASDRLQALRGLAVETLGVPDAASGMAASFRAIGSICREPVLIMLGDMPDIETEDLRRLIADHRAHPDRVVRAATEGGVPGQPVLFPARLVARFGYLTGDTGAKPLLSGEDTILRPLPGTRAVTDLDTPEAWAAWRAGLVPDARAP